MIDFSTLQGLTIPEGVVTQITDASGVVLWSAVKEVGSLILRPSADISVGHKLVDNLGGEITSAYLLINEEISDDSSTYIESPTGEHGSSVTSKFKLSVSGQLINKPFVVTSVNVMGQTMANSANETYEYKNEFWLEINGVETSTVECTTNKSAFDLAISDAIWLINEAVATNGTLPNININVTSYTFVPQNVKTAIPHGSGVTQVYVVLGYEA